METGDSKFNPHGLFVVPKKEKTSKQSSEQILENLSDIPLTFFVANKDRNSRIVDVSFAPELRQRVGSIMSLNFQDQESYRAKIKKITGFNVESLNAKLDELQKEYIGKTEAPFVTEGEDNLLSF
jgi:hypothetical protein